ncbi:MAG: hypothetical protein GF355_10760 [Candidatus Eisenbacteria bacterium]|nr:hypothetical protein [Candidatus Eisenbacteria bacterium]
MKRLIWMLALVLAAGTTASGADGAAVRPTQQPGLLKTPASTSSPWLLGSVTGLEKLRIAHSMSFAYTSGGALSGPSGQYLTTLSYPLRSNLNLDVSFGLDWNPAFTEAMGRGPTSFGLRDVRLDWRPSRSTTVTFEYLSRPAYSPWSWRRHGRPWWGEDEATRSAVAAE